MNDKKNLMKKIRKQIAEKGFSRLNKFSNLFNKLFVNENIKLKKKK